MRSSVSSVAGSAFARDAGRTCGWSRVPPTRGIDRVSSRSGCRPGSLRTTSRRSAPSKLRHAAAAGGGLRLRRTAARRRRAAWPFTTTPDAAVDVRLHLVLRRRHAGLRARPWRRRASGETPFGAEVGAPARRARGACAGGGVWHATRAAAARKWPPRREEMHRVMVIVVVADRAIGHHRRCLRHHWRVAAGSAGRRFASAGRRCSDRRCGTGGMLGALTAVPGAASDRRAGRQARARPLRRRARRGGARRALRRTSRACGWSPRGGWPGAPRRRWRSRSPACSAPPAGSSSSGPAATLSISSSLSSPSVSLTRSAPTRATVMPLTVSPCTTRRALPAAGFLEKGVVLPSTTIVPDSRNWPALHLRLGRFGDRRAARGGASD